MSDANVVRLGLQGLVLLYGQVNYREDKIDGRGQETSAKYLPKEGRRLGCGAGRYRSVLRSSKLIFGASFCIDITKM